MILNDKGMFYFLFLNICYYEIFLSLENKTSWQSFPLTCSTFGTGTANSHCDTCPQGVFLGHGELRPIETFRAPVASPRTQLSSVDMPACCVVASLSQLPWTCTGSESRTSHPLALCSAGPAVIQQPASSRPPLEPRDGAHSS